MLTRNHIFSIAILCLSSLTSSSAQAFDGCNGLGMAYLFGYGANIGRMQSFVPTPPYFALHPPVYYGERYTRPYGMSPFAAWPQLQPTAGYHGQRSVDRSMSVANPYYPHSAKAAPASASIVTAKPAEPLVIENPFFRPESVQMTATKADIH